MSVRVVCGESCEEDNDVVATYCGLVRPGDKAVLVEFDQGNIWVPFSHIVAHDESERTLRLTAWIADREGIEADE